MHRAYLSKLFRFMFFFLPFGVLMAPTLVAAQQFKAGQQVNSHWVGVSLKVPPGFNARYDQEAGALMISDNRDVTLAVFGASEGDLETMGELSVEAVKEMGVHLVPQQVTQPDANTLNASFSAWLNMQPRVVQGTVRKGPYGNVVSVMGMGPSGQQQKVSSVINSVTASLQWKQPQTGGQRQKLAGKMLYRSGGSSDGRSGPGGFTAYSNSKTQIDFCSNGQYGYQSVSESSISVGGAYGSQSASNNSKHQGRWWLVADLGGQHYLYLESNQDKYYLWPISETANGASVDGKHYNVSASRRCS